MKFVLNLVSKVDEDEELHFGFDGSWRKLDRQVIREYFLVKFGVMDS